MAFESTAAVGQPFAERGAFHDPCLAPLEGSGSSAGSRCPLPDILVPCWSSITGFDRVIRLASDPFVGSSTGKCSTFSESGEVPKPASTSKVRYVSGTAAEGRRSRPVGSSKAVSHCDPRVEVGDEPWAAQVHPWHRYFAR